MLELRIGGFGRWGSASLGAADGAAAPCRSSCFGTDSDKGKHLEPMAVASRFVIALLGTQASESFNAFFSRRVRAFPGALRPGELGKALDSGREDTGRQVDEAPLAKGARLEAQHGATLRAR